MTASNVQNIRTVKISFRLGLGLVVGLKLGLELVKYCRFRTFAFYRFPGACPVVQVGRILHSRWAGSDFSNDVINQVVLRPDLPMLIPNKSDFKFERKATIAEMA